MSIYKEVSQKKLRFESEQGLLTVEQLWDLPLTARSGKVSLDSVGMALVQLTRETAPVESLVDPTTVPEETRNNQLRLAVVKDIISTRKAMIEARETVEANKSEREYLEGLLRHKQHTAMMELTEEELTARIKALS